MSVPELSPAVDRAVQLARRLAALDKLHEASPLHLFAALTHEEEGRVAVLLGKAGAPHAKLAASFLEAKDLEAPLLEDALPAVGADIYAVLVRARSFAVELAGEHVVASEHLLLALLESDANLQRRLQSLGFDFRILEQQVKGEQETPLPMEELEILEPTDWIDASRILDASANRAREGLRVVEDYCRFALDDRFLVEETKQIRHVLTEALGEIPIQARDTERDVGVSVTTPQEGERTNPRHVVRANLKRVQEALRSLEEYAKYALSHAMRALEQLRYRTYTLERMILVQDHARSQLAQIKLYVLLTRGLAAAALDWTIQEAAAGGAGMFQLREKNYTDRELLEVARNVRRRTAAAKTLFIVNDRPDIARLVGADGVHLGQDDMSVKDARRILGPQAIIGVSTHNLDDIKALADGASYLGVGPTFTSGTKDFSQLAGLEFVRTASATTGLPWFAIGGIKASNVGEVIQAGAKRIAVSQAVIAAEEPRMAAAQLVEGLGATR